MNWVQNITKQFGPIRFRQLLPEICSVNWSENTMGQFSPIRFRDEGDQKHLVLNRKKLCPLLLGYRLWELGI
jgi:hypothetical protein